MKKMNYLRITATIALFLIAGLGLFAQYVGPTATTYEDENSDYVTIGSRMPYYVAPDETIADMQTAGTMDYSNFRWEVLQSDLSALAITPATYANAALTEGEGLAPWVTQNEISVTWADPTVVAGTQYVIRVTEHSNPLGAGNFTLGCEDATPEIRNVYVLARPTIDWGTAQTTGCGITPGAASTFYVPLDVTGLGEWEVTYSVTYNGAAYIASTTSAALGTATTVTSDATVIAEAAATKNLEGTPDSGTDGLPVVLNGGGTLNGYGYYDVTITNITDRISRKSLDMALVASQVDDIPATAYRIYVNPTPVTNPIQHLENL